MLESPLISIIVPVYNAEKYLHQCIESILCQSYKNFELLLIIDGSKDTSGKICDEFAAKDERIKVFHKENGGVSTARNTGIDNAKGEYICFIDSDDWVEYNYLENFGISKSISEGTLYIQGIKDSKNQIITRNNKLSYDINGIIEGSICYAIESTSLFHNGYPFSKIYEKSILEKNTIIFKSGIHLHEDLIFNLEYFKYIKAIHVSSEAGYIYIHRNNNSLSQRYLPYEERLVILRSFHEKSIELITYFSIGNKYKHEVNQIFTSLLYQTLYSIYRPEFKIKMQKKRNYIRELLQDYYELFLIGDLGFMSKYIIKTKSPWVIDKYYSFLFSCRYTFSGLYNLYRNIAK